MGTIERLRKERRAAEGILRKRLPDCDPRRYATGEMKKAILIRDGFRCRYCGTDLKSQKAWIDHVIPWSRGGPTQPSNMVAVCGQCNNNKGGRQDVRPRHLGNGYGGPVAKLPKSLNRFMTTLGIPCGHRASPNCNRVSCLWKRKMARDTG